MHASTMHGSNNMANYKLLYPKEIQQLAEWIQIPLPAEYIRR